METRPAIETISEGKELRRWYWLKDELIARASQVGVKTDGGKFTILERLIHFLDTGETRWPGDKKTKPTSTFDWHSETLDDDTVITDSYKNSQNVRRYFHDALGESFRFNIAFMDWMKANTGRTLADACRAYRAIEAERQSPDFQSEIMPHNQFNQYTRDFLADNPDRAMNDVRKFWALKRALPSDNGMHVYDRSDLDLDSGT